jgi:dienelactone hydrolase
MHPCRLARFCACISLACLLTAVLPAATDNRAVAEAAFDELIRQDFSALVKRFSPEVLAALPADAAAAKLGPIVQSLGPLRSGRPVPRVASVQGSEVFIFPSEFQNTKTNVVITVNAASQVSGLRSMPPDPEPARPGDLFVVTGDLKLPATLAVPSGDGPFPAVVFLHGSGPEDRDETLGPNAPFKDLAEGLAARGVASLRFEKRTKQYPGRPVATVKDEVIDDALNALALLRQQPKIDPKRVYLLGHSVGGYLIPRIAPSDPAVAGFIMLAGNARPIEELVADQMKYLGAPPEALAQVMRAFPASYLNDLKAYDPTGAALKITVPLLILQGERDYQVTMKDFEMWRAALKGRQNVTLKSYSKLNHLFLEGEGKSMPAEYGQPGHIPAYVLDDLAGFMRAKAGR